MMRLLFSLLVMSLTTQLFATDTLFVREARLPILLERKDNILFYMRIDASKSETLNNIVLKFGNETNLKAIQSVKLYYSGTEALQDAKQKRFAPMTYLSFSEPGKTMEANRSYSILKSENVKITNSTVTLKADQKLFKDINYFWISIQVKPKASLQTKITATIQSASIDGKKAVVDVVSEPNIVHRVATGVRNAGDDDVYAYRIPGLATTNKGTLLGVYDVRYNNSADLQEYVDVGLSRSTNGGQSWEAMRLPLCFGEEGGLPKAQNGVGDPAILVDETNNNVWIVAAWTHGMGNKRAWFSSHPGMDKNETAQLILTKSSDDGKTWSQPINITPQVKDPSWYFLLQGPGRGITMQNGTLVFPIQFIDSTRIPNAGIMYSEDRGETWHLHNLARTNTTEAQVVEIEPGVLMLNMRDNRGGTRAVATTTDLGRTWTEHESSRSALQEPICMASIWNVPAKDNVLNKDILLFSNPNSTKYRNMITIKASLDKGKTWLPEHQVLLDEGHGWGYSCLTMVDKETIGILYESSVSQMTFQTIKLVDLIK